jgi:hypothetical protein
MKKQIFFILIPPVHSKDHFAGMLTLDDEKLSKEMAKECGGTYVPVSFFLN